MASPSRLPFVRKPSQRRPLSMIDATDSAATLETQSLSVVDDATLRERNSKKSKRLSLLPQFSKRSSNDEKGAESREEVVHEEVEVDEGVANGQTSNEAVLSSDRAAQNPMPPPSSRLSRLGRPRPVSMMPSATGTASSGRSQIGGHSRTTSQDPPNDRSTAMHRTKPAMEPPGHARSSTVDNGVQRSGSTRLPQTPRPVIPSRTTSVRPGTGSGRPPPSRAGPGHARTDTNSSQISPSKARPSRDRTGSSSTIASEAAIVNTEGSKPSAQSKAAPLSHAATAHTRHTSTSTLSRTSPPRASAALGGRPVSMIAPPAIKPAFSTYQQHYSPAKSTLPKPLLPETRSSSARVNVVQATTSDVSLIEVQGDIEVAKQQLELLQLVTLHEASTQALSAYGVSAKMKLGNKHEQLGTEYENVRLNELQHQRATNLTALENWCPDRSLLVENLQILSMVYSDLASLNGHGSRYQDVLGRFESWMKDAESPSSSSAFLKPLGEDWKSALASVTLKLRSIQRNLNVLPPPPPQDTASALTTVMTACRDLVEDRLRELEIMVKVEREMLARERHRVEEEARDVAHGSMGGEAGETSPQWVPAWQKVS